MSEPTSPITDAEVPSTAPDAAAEHDNESVAGLIPLLYGRRAPMSKRQARQFAGTDTELDMKSDNTSDVNRKENIVAVVWR